MTNQTISILIADKRSKVRSSVAELAKSTLAAYGYSDLNIIEIDEDFDQVNFDWGTHYKIALIGKLSVPEKIIDLTETIFKNTSPKHAPQIIVYDEENTRILTQAIESGISDYCTKLKTELPLRLELAINRQKARESVHATYQKILTLNQTLAKQSITDDLTGLYEMHYFKRRLKQEFTRSRRYDKFISVIMFDVDNFKQVNDTNDHLMGSYVLAEIGSILKNTIRTVDTAARFGGDEFVIMLPETGPEGALLLAERIAERIAKRTFKEKNNTMKVTISAGIATYGPGLEEIEDDTELLRNADLYMYEAKNSGRNQVVDRNSSPGLGKK